MKTIQSYILLTTSLLCTANAASPPRSIEAYFSYCSFNDPSSQPYLETYISFIGNSLQYKKNKNNKLQAEVDILIAIKQNDKIIDFIKQTLLSPEEPDSATGFRNFIDQQRFSLPNGSYELEIEIKDRHNQVGKIFKHTEQLHIAYLDNEIQLSDIQLVESFSKASNPSILTKSGYDLIPYVSVFYPQSLQAIRFYAEVYNTEKILGPNEKMLINSYLESAETAVRLNDYNAFSRKNTGVVIVIFNEFPIGKLPSGNYNLVVEVRSKDNMLMARRKLFIQRSNSGVSLNYNDIATLNVENSFVAAYNHPDTLAEYIRCLWPIATPIERAFAENQLKSADIDLRKKFFYNFWYSRNSLNPEQEWLNYREKVKQVNAAFGTRIMKGYDSDRGRIYLQYGPPNTITQRLNEPNAYPYEIWHYYQIRNFNNKRFIFYNPDLVSNDFRLLHSDMIGEINNPRWQLVLHSRNTLIPDLDQERIENQFGSESDDLFRAPR